MNYLRTAVLLAATTALFLGAGFMLGGEAGMLIALVIALGMNLFAYWNSDRMVLAMYGAREAPGLYGTVEQLADRAGLPMPRVYIIDSDQPNAFATGRNPANAAVAGTSSGDSSRNNPLGLVGTILLMILAPLAAALVQMAISRTREFAADGAAAEISGKPLWLAAALEKLDSAARHIEYPAAEEHPAMAHSFIVNPLSGQSMDRLFSTHPRMEQPYPPAARDSRSRGPVGMSRARSTVAP